MRAPREPGEAPAAAPRQPARVLVVDDNVDAAEAIATLLQFSGYQIDVAHDPHDGARGRGAREARSRAARHRPARHDAATKSRSACARAAAGGRAKIVALTGYGQEQDNEQAKAAGFAAYLVKPVDADELTALVNELTDA